MAITEVNPLTKFKDKDGNVTVIYPTTKIGNVIGLNELIRNQSVTTTGNGSAYAVSIEGVNALTAGISFIMIPHVESTTTEPTINVNGLGAAGIRRRLSADVNTIYAGPTNGWLKAGKPIRLTYDGSFWIADLLRPSATDLAGIVPIANGGTGASTAEAARANILPPVTSKDKGKNLRVSEDGIWVVGKTAGLATVYVTAPAGVTVTATKDGETIEEVADSNCLAIFDGLTIGMWTISISNELQTQTRTVYVEPDYTTSIKFFEATIKVTYPAGSTCTCSNGNYTFNAPDTSGSCTFSVFRAGDWTIDITDGTDNDSEVVRIASDGQSESVIMAYFAAYIKVTYPAGSTCTCSQGSTTLTASDTIGEYTFTVKDTGTWTIYSTDGNQEDSATVTITSSEQSESVSLKYFAAYIEVTYPEASTCTCSDGDTTLTASDTSGSYTFTVKNTGTWMVTATDGEKTKSEDVVITTDGESKTLILAYILYLYNRGDLCEEESGGWNSVFQSKTLGGELYDTWAKKAINTDNIYTAYKRSADDYGNWSLYFTGVKIDFAGYTTLNIVANGNTKNCGIGVSSSADTSGRIATTAAKYGLNTYQLDISSISSGYVFFGVASTITFDGTSGSNSSSGVMYTYEIYLT